MIARGTFASQHFENVDAFAYLAFTGSSSCDAEKIREAEEFIPNSSRGQPCRPAKQQRNAAGGLKKVLFLPAVMIAKKIAMVGKKTDENVVGVWSRFDSIENSPETIVQISDLAVVTSLHDFC